MKIIISKNVLLSLLLFGTTKGFVIPQQKNILSSRILQSSQQPEEPPTLEKKEQKEDKTTLLVKDNEHHHNQLASSHQEPSNNNNNEEEEKEVEGLPWWWEYIWDLDAMKPSGKTTGAVSFGDSANVFRTNIEQIYGGYDSLDNCPMAEGALDDLADGTMFIGLQQYKNTFGSPYKLCFGPKSFLVISDPMQFKHILRDANACYDKGVLAEILKPIMGKGLIPADPETWKVRRRQIAPAFHKAWLNHMVGLFGYCNRPLLQKLKAASESSARKVEMEERFCSVALDIIGKSIFNYDFGSVTSESPVIKAVYNTLVEAEHRSMTPAPYWDLPLANELVPRLRKFNADIGLLNSVLDELIQKAKETRTVEDIEELEQRNYDQVKDPSLLRFMVDMKGADMDNKQLRDDLMTMLIAGHETTAAVLTWALYELVRNPECMKKAQEEVDRVLGGSDRAPTLKDVQEMEYIRLCCAESLRLYPEPPLLIRRCRTPNDLPKQCGSSLKEGIEDSPNPHVIRGMDIFLATYNIHRDERFWPNANAFDPDRFLRPYKNPEVPEWKGYDPDRWRSSAQILYPNEGSADFAYLPFGAGARKCVGDNFAMLEATVSLAMVLRDFDFEFDLSKKTTDMDHDGPTFSLDHPVGMRTGATIHTRYGLHMLINERKHATTNNNDINNKEETITQ
eukprot:CAMPEP_0194179874 /NCGR_PEP_ID=MMETSP0154-20130528/13271_1 /TAXON_ID=1049557 /ORGANISM="Thalassiothrix antarctica, Strain L6-D1" /LENGTH=677 /DNA_ID=CAMNT_0038895405 /DNA_START=38 /DNA_END=2071 /DNA_ORIENTATION=+